MAAIKALAVVEQANQLSRGLPPEAFYNELIRLAVLICACAGRETRPACSRARRKLCLLLQVQT